MKKKKGSVKRNLTITILNSILNLFVSLFNTGSKHTKIAPSITRSGLIVVSTAVEVGCGVANTTELPSEIWKKKDNRIKNTHSPIKPYKIFI